MTKEVRICGNPRCCTDIRVHDDGSVNMKEATTGKEIYIPADDWKEIKNKIKSGEL